MTAPRFMDYPDRGCEYSPSCLRCHLPVCKYDKPDRDSIRSIEEKESRFRRIADAMDRGVPRFQVRRDFNVSDQTVWRAVKWAAKEGGNATG